MINKNKFNSFSIITYREIRQQLGQRILGVAFLLLPIRFLVLLLCDQVEPLAHLSIEGPEGASRHDRQKIGVIVSFSITGVKVFLDALPDARVLLVEVAGDVGVKMVKGVTAALVDVLFELFVVGVF